MKATPQVRYKRATQGFEWPLFLPAFNPAHFRGAIHEEEIQSYRFRCQLCLNDVMIAWMKYKRKIATCPHCNENFRRLKKYDDEEKIERATSLAAEIIKNLYTKEDATSLRSEYLKVLYNV